jgi:hypothetical protein
MKRLLICALAAAALLAGTGAEAHRDHKKKEEAAEQEKAELARAGQARAEHPGDAAAAARSGAPVAAPTPAEAEAEAELPFFARALDYAGRFHPFAVHFPIALFPVVWIALILARGRGESVALIRSLIVVAGSAAAAAALLGWPNSAGADAEAIFALHRWIGTALGLGGLALAAVALRSPAAAASRAMVWALGFSTLAILVQGWLGAALVHGADHLAW